MSACKDCRNAYNKEKAREIGHAVLYRKSLERNPEQYKEKQRAYYEANKEKVKERSRKWSLENPELKKANRKAEYERKRAEFIQRASQWARENPERRKQIVLASRKRARQERPEFAIPSDTAKKMLARVLSATGKKKRGKTFAILGYNRDDLVRHLEALFQPGMGWHNHGAWHVDHIIPVAELVKCGVTDPAKINALANLRPLWARENNSKSAKFELAPPETAFITKRKPCRQSKSQTTALTC